MAYECVTLSMLVNIVFMIVCMDISYSKPTSRVPLQNLQQNMLNIFGIKSRPRPDIFSSVGRDTTSAKKYMLGLYKHTQLNDVGIVSNTSRTSNISNTIVDDADTVVSFVNHAYVPRPNASDEQGVMYFDVSSNLVVESTLASELRIYLDVKQKTLKDNVFKVTIYQIVIPKLKYLPLSSRIVNATSSEWHEFDVLKASSTWKDRPSENNGILVECETMNNKVKTISECGIVDFKGSSEGRPFIVSFYQSGDEDEILAAQLPKEKSKMYVERVRRSITNVFPRANPAMELQLSEKNRNKGKITCQRHPLYIAFSDLGWSDWIIAPEGYIASYCKGGCHFPLDQAMNATNHAIIQLLIFMTMPSAIPEPCCAPIRLEPLQVLFLDDRNNVVMKRYSNMIVNDCGCQ